MGLRLARADELRRLWEIERAAGDAFREVGMAEIADDESPTIATLAGYQVDGRALVAVDADDRPVAYILIDDLDGACHIEQVSVDPAHAHRGIGQALIEHVARIAAERGARALTLTTFADVPWNAPYYERIGFVVMTPAEITPGLAAVRAEEAAHGLDRWPRVCMRRLLQTGYGGEPRPPPRGMGH